MKQIRSSAEGGSASDPGMIAAGQKAVIAVLFCIMAAPPLLGCIWDLDDLGRFHLPLRKFYSDSLASGDSFQWMPSIFSGMHVTGEGQLGAWHPWHYLLYKIFPLRAAWALELLSSYVAMALGMRCWLGCSLGNRSAAWHGSIVFTFSSFCMLHFVHPNAVAVIAHIPWLLWTQRRCLQACGTASSRDAPWWGACVALLTASQVLLGYPQYMWISVIAEGAFLIGQVGIVAVTPGLVGFALLASCKVTGMLLGGMQIAATFEAFLHSHRVNPSTDFLLAGSLHPINILQWGAPYGFADRVVSGNTHEFGIYMGMSTAWLVALGFRDHNGRELTMLRNAATALAIAALLLAFGRHAGLIYLPMQLPIIGSFRVPARYMLLFHLGLAFLAAHGVRSVLQNANLSRARIDKAAFAWLAFSVACSVWITAADERVKSSLLLIAAGPAVALLFWLGLKIAFGPHQTASLQRRSYLILWVSLFTAVDLGVYGLSYAVYHKVMPRRLKDAAYLQPPPGKIEGKVLVEKGSFNPDEIRRVGNGLTLLGYSQVDGYAGLEPSLTILGPTATVNALRAAGVQWVWKEAIPVGSPLSSLRAHGDWLEVTQFVPRFKLWERAIQSTTPSDVWSQAGQLEATVEKPVPIIAKPAGSNQGSVSVVVDAPGLIQLRVTASGPRLLGTTERHHPGWKGRRTLISRDETASVDSDLRANPLEILRINGDFIGVLVPAGEHEVTLRFQPQSLRWGKVCTTSGVLLLGVLLILPRLFFGAAQPMQRAHVVWGLSAWCLFTGVCVAIGASPHRIDYRLRDAPSDLDFYKKVTKEISQGKGYYETLATELPKHQFPTSSVFNWRPPLPLWSIGKLGKACSLTVFALLGVALFVLGTVLLRRDGGLAGGLLGGLMLSSVAMLGFMPDLMHAPILWGAVLIGISVTLFGWERPRLAVLIGVLGAFFRELAIGYSLTMLCFAIWNRNYRESLHWVVGIAAFAIYYAFHCHQVSQQVVQAPIDQDSNWLQFHGLAIVVGASQMLGYLLLAPQWVSALWLSLVVLGWWGADREWEKRAALTGAAYFAVFMLVGQEVNQYWGQLIAPFMCLGFGCFPSHLKKCWRISFPADSPNKVKPLTPEAPSGQP